MKAVGATGAAEGERPRVVAGFGRSGTTWIQDVLAKSNRLRPVFEPLHPAHIKGADEFAHRYVPADTEAPDLYDFLQPFFWGRYAARWSDYRIPVSPLKTDPRQWRSGGALVRYLRDQKNAVRNLLEFAPQRRYSRRIVKFVRANMMLAWLQARFDARIVFVIRHPAAVILSQMSARGAWNPARRIARYRRDDSLLEALPKPVREMLFADQADVESFALSWCIENIIALREAAASGIHVVYYERLLSHPDAEWSRVMQALELSRRPEKSLVSQPSQQAWGEKARNPALVRRYDAWMEQIGGSVADRIQVVLDKAGLDVYEIGKAEPKVADHGRGEGRQKGRVQS